jgi:DNA polymerase III epsilon subunit family exonuclease
VETALQTSFDDRSYDDRSYDERSAYERSADGRSGDGRSGEAPATPLSEVTFVVVDVETTGGSPASGSLTEVAAARYRGGELLGTYRTFVRPDERIPPFITALTGISDAMVADAPRVGEMLPSFLEFVGASVVVGHNLRFDLSFINHALVATGREPLERPCVDTLALARRLVRDMVPDCKLGTLAAGLRLEHQPSHRALSDVLATGDLLHALLERAGSFGIVGLDELLVLPRLIGHPQGAKLALTTRLPHRPGVYWFTDATGTVLYVGRATDLRTRVRSYFGGDRQRKVGRLLRQLHAVHHRVCPDPLTAAVIEGRLIRAWSPAFNQQGKVRHPSGPGRGGPSRRRGRRRQWTADELSRDPLEVLGPMADALRQLSEQHRYEEAAAVRDEAEQLQRLMVRHRQVETLRESGRVELSIDGGTSIELDGGLLVGGGPAASDPGLALTADGHEHERIIVSQWLAANPERVRILSVGSPAGWALAVGRIPSLSELCTQRLEASASPEVSAA